MTVANGVVLKDIDHKLHQRLLLRRKNGDLPPPPGDSGVKCDNDCDGSKEN